MTKINVPELVKNPDNYFVHVRHFYGCKLVSNGIVNSNSKIQTGLVGTLAIVFDKNTQILCISTTKVHPIEYGRATKKRGYEQSIIKAFRTMDHFLKFEDCDGWMADGMACYDLNNPAGVLGLRSNFPAIYKCLYDSPDRFTRRYLVGDEMAKGYAVLNGMKNTKLLLTNKDFNLAFLNIMNFLDKKA